MYAKYGGVEVTIDGEEFLIVPAKAVASDEPAHPDAPGRDTETLRRVARLLTEVAEVQADEASARRDSLVRAMLKADIDPIPADTVAQAHRLARQRERLLVSGALDVGALSITRGDSSKSATRTWLARRRKAGELFTVSYEGSTLLPAFQLDSEGNPLPLISRVLSSLRDARLGSWATWTWFCSTSSWLGGLRPLDLLDQPDRIVNAADRFVSNVA